MRGRIFSLVLTNLDDICMSYVNWSELRSTVIANTFHRFDVKQTDFSNADCYAVALKFVIEHTLCVFGM